MQEMVKDESDTDYIREAAEQVSILFMINAKVSGDNIYCTYADDFQATYEVTKSLLFGEEKRKFFLCMIQNPTVPDRKWRDTKLHCRTPDIPFVEI